MGSPRQRQKLAQRGSRWVERESMRMSRFSGGTCNDGLQCRP